MATIRFKKSSSKRRRANFLTTVVLLIIMVGWANYYHEPTTYHYLDDDLTFTFSKDPKLENIMRQGQNICPTNGEDGFCKTPCWNGPPYQEPNFLLSPNCTEYSTKQLLIYVYTRLDNFKERETIRYMFNNYTKQNRNISAALMFIVGLPETETADSIAVLNDHTTQGDILQIDIPDTYINLGFKGIAAFKWAQQCGGPSQYFAKMDDDSNHILDINYMFMTLSTIRKQKNETQNRLVCLRVLHNVAAHEPKVKTTWEASFQQYFARRFPPYCFGNAGIFMNRQVAISLYKAARGRPVFHIDDVYTTGLLRQRACVPYVDWTGVFDFLNQVLYKVLQYYSGTHSYQFISKDVHRQERALALEVEKRKKKKL